MARLTEAEKTQLLRPLKQGSDLSSPAPQRRSAREYIEFTTFASRFTRAEKPVRFEGKWWKL